MRGANELWAEKADRLEAAFLKLRLSSPGAVGIPYVALLPSIARELLMLAHGPDDVPSAMKPASTARSKRQLAAVGKAADLLAGAIADLNRPARDALILSDEWLRRVSGDLALLRADARNAEVPEQAATEGTGRPKKLVAQRVSHWVGLHYQGLTGKPPSIAVSAATHVAGGQFVDLLREVFEVLELKASAESQAKALIREMKEKTPP